MANPISPQEKQIRAEEIRQYLLNLTGPMTNYDKLVAELTQVLSFLNRLKAFLQFLTKLRDTPAKYFSWMHKAFSQYVPTPSTTETVPAGHDNDESMSFNADYEFDFPAAPKESKKAAKKKRVAVT